MGKEWLGLCQGHWAPQEKVIQISGPTDRGDSCRSSCSSGSVVSWSPAVELVWLLSRRLWSFWLQVLVPAGLRSHDPGLELKNNTLHILLKQYGEVQGLRGQSVMSMRTLRVGLGTLWAFGWLGKCLNMPKNYCYWWRFIFLVPFWAFVSFLSLQQCPQEKCFSFPLEEGWQLLNCGSY